MANGNGTYPESPLQAEAYYIFANLPEPTINGVLQEMRLRKRGVGRKRLIRWSEEHDWSGRLTQRAERIHAIAQVREADFLETVDQLNHRIYENLYRISDALMNGIIAGSEEKDGVRILGEKNPMTAIKKLIEVNTFMRLVRGLDKPDEGSGSGGISILNMLYYLSEKVDPQTGKPLGKPSNGNGNGRIDASAKVIDP